MYPQDYGQLSIPIHLPITLKKYENVCVCVCCVCVC
ncbi:unnamed protein product [Spirodela intermedia]|uniref:Uncharacterized protein n=1 Tax=Spirodela intermedia TaxID=51605 RepID=A0ABN7EC75_SPIIN|nr:unnamed protein product [Spirodela intermedia]